MLYLNYIVYVCFFVLFMNMMLGCKNVSDVLYTICYVLMQCQSMSENMVCNVSYIVLSFMYIIFRCCLILCYIFMFVIRCLWMESIISYLTSFLSFFQICIFHHV